MIKRVIIANAVIVRICIASTIAVPTITVADVVAFSSLLFPSSCHESYRPPP